MYAFVDGAVDLNRRRDQGGAGFGGVGVILVRMRQALVHAYQVVGVPFWPHSMFISNNTMEIMAVQVACNLLQEQIQKGEDVQIWTDSTYTKGSLEFGSSWMPKKNVALIDFVRRSTARKNVHIHHCLGHKGFVWNELADMAATKSVALKRGFDKTYECSISRLCFRCSGFPCGVGDAKEFAVKTACLRNPHAYSGIVGCERFKAGQVEGIDHE